MLDRSRAERRSDDAWTTRSLPGLEFPGFTPRCLKRSEIAAYEGHLEFWDARTETAWLCEPATPPVHERPCRALAERIAGMRRL